MENTDFNRSPRIGSIGLTTGLRCESADHKHCFNGCLDVTRCTHDRTTTLKDLDENNQ